MRVTIKVDNFIRLKQSHTGTVIPARLPRLSSYLAGDAGEIHYSFSGRSRSDAAGSQKNSIKCIIYGWFFLIDPISLEAVRHDLQIESTLVVVKDESMLPPLELEADDEDYIVCDGEMDVLERVEEEILLDLPAAAIHAAVAVAPGKAAGKVAGPSLGPATTRKNSPFAKLAELKKK
jgi:hypothetical protein